jgi:hypothetical protein
MKEKINRKKSVNKRLTINYHLWVRAALCSQQPPQSKTLQRQQHAAQQAALPGRWKATNHL